MEPEIEGGELCAMAVIANKRGLHARAAAKFVKIAETFMTELTVVKGEMKVSASSIMGLMMLAAVKGTEIKICGAGPDAEAAVEALVEFVKRKFDEE
jgi:phosphocarrier protein HPr